MRKIVLFAALAASLAVTTAGHSVSDTCATRSARPRP